MKLKKKSGEQRKLLIKRQSREWEKKSLSAIYVTEDLYLQYTRKQKSLTIEKTNNPVRKWAMDLNGESLKGEIQRTKGHCVR